MGPAGTGKGVAMSVGRDLLMSAGYKKFAATKASKEAFILHMQRLKKEEVEDEMSRAKSILDVNISDYTDVMVMASEFNSFVPPGDVDFLMELTDLWDNIPFWDNPKITSKSVKIEKPTLNILAANTPQMFNTAFPADAIGSGTLSRFLLIHGTKTKKRQLILTRPDPELKKFLVDVLVSIKSEIKGEATFTPDSLKLLSNIYEDYVPSDDTRFEAYNERRIAHLIKLCLIHAAADLSTEVRYEHVLNANTQLCAAEFTMPKALGHFGRSKASILMHKIVEFVGNHPMGVASDKIKAALHREFTNVNELTNLLRLLYESGELKVTNDHTWHMIEKKFPQWAVPYINPELLTDQEKDECNLLMPSTSLSQLKA